MHRSGARPISAHYQNASLKLEQQIISKLCLCGGSLSLTALYEDLLENSLIANGSSEEGIHEFCTKLSPHNVRVFKLHDDVKRNECTVSVITDLVLCSKYQAKLRDCKKPAPCRELHICIHALFGHCEKKKCAFPHLLNTDHNRPILEESGLAHLEEKHILEILTKCLRNIEHCTFYNNSKRCSKDGCKYLHICRHYIIGDCRFNTGLKPCNYSHDLKGKQPMTVWEWFKVDVSCMNKTDMLRMLRPEDEDENDGNSSEGSEDEEMYAAAEVSTSDEKIPVPEACTFYKKQNSCKKGDQCTYLHVCRYFILGNCKYGTKCDCSHNIKSPHAMSVWRKFPSADAGNKTEDELLQLLRKSKNFEGTGANGNDDQLSAKFDRGMRIEERDKNEVCQYHLCGRCDYGDDCHRVHTDQNYHWQWRSKDKWNSFGPQLQIEQKFCDANVECFSEAAYTFNFTKMHLSLVLEQKTSSMRRLETPGIPPATDGSVTRNSWHKIMNTVWSWYWLENGNIWMEYASKQDIEGEYQKYRADRDTSFEFRAGRFTYALNFETMLQINLSIGTRRKVRRRPQFVSLDDLQKKVKLLRTMADNIPANWDKSKVPTNPTDNFARCKLNRTTVEYNHIVELFAKDMNSSLIVDIERIQNIEQWNYFTLKRQSMIARGAQEQRELFHGAPSTAIQAICQQNFDVRISGCNAGTSYGHGSYLSTSAKYSHRYTQPDPSRLHYMFLVQVMVGDYKPGISDYRRPPPKNPSEPNGALYDSCVDNESLPKIFVIFDTKQVYPEYLITYRG